MTKQEDYCVIDGTRYRLVRDDDVETVGTYLEGRGLLEASRYLVEHDPDVAAHPIACDCYQSVPDLVTAAQDYLNMLEPMHAVEAERAVALQITTYYRS